MPEPTDKLFISHASEDKPRIVMPLVEALKRKRVDYWLDQEQIEVSESISEEVNEGLRVCRYVAVILTPTYMKKNYTRAELRAALGRQASSGVEIIIPVLEGTEEERREALSIYPLLADTKALVWEGDADAVAEAICRRVRPGARAVSRACFISSEYPPLVAGGLGVHVDQLTKALAEHMDVDVVLASPGREGYDPSHPRVHLHQLADVSPSYSDPVSWLRFANQAADRIARAVARDAPPDIIHCHDWVTVLAGIKCRWRLGVPLVFHLHLPNRAPLCASVENLGLISADLVTVNSESMHAGLQTRGLRLRSVEVIPNGVDTGAFAPAADWPKDDGYVLFVGRLVQQKGVEHLLRAFYCVKEKFPDVRLKVVGRGELKPMLQTLAGNLMLAEQVEFVDWKTGPELVELYQRARVVVVPSIYEPFGMTALEAMACQRPVVASRVGGLTDVVSEGTGFHAQPRDDLDLAQWIMALLADPGLRASMGRAGRARVLERGYTWPRVAERFVEQYESLHGRPVVNKRPDRSSEFEAQIRTTARELNPSLDRNMLDELFRWED